MLRSFAVYDTFLIYLVLPILFLLSLTCAASGAPSNVTVRFDSPLVSFSPGWSSAEFEGAGTQDEFAFANKAGEQLVVQLPQNVSAVFYQAFKSNGGALWFACLDCDPSVTNAAGANVIEVDAHDDSENGTQPPEILFYFPDVDPTQQHVLTVVNLEDVRFNNSNQITFDALILTTTDEQSSSTTTTSTSATSSITDRIPTFTVTAHHWPMSTLSGPHTVSTTTLASSQSEPTATNGSSGGGTVDSTTSGQGTQPTGSSQSGSVGVTSTSTSPNQSGQPSGAPQSSSDGSQGSSTSNGNSPSGGQTTSPTISSSASLTTTSTDPTSTNSIAISSGTTASSSAGLSGPGSTSSISSAAPASASSGQSDNSSSSNSGVSKTVIIVVAVIASLFVLALLGAITWLLIRNQPPPPSADPEGRAGLMREAAPTAIVSGPVGLAPMRPQNPFVDTVPPNVPLDDGPLAGPPSEPILYIGAPAIPPRSPLRAAYAGSPTRPAWLTRQPRTPSPTSDE